jgi:hypothetical protein
MSKTDVIMKNIEQYGLAVKGKREIVKHLYGERLTIREMAIAKCYDCMGYYSDGRGTDCEISTCSLYPIMPYRKQGEKYVGKKMPPMTEAHKQKLRDRMKAIHAK